MTLKAPRGTQDILPDRTPAWAALESRCREVFDRYGFREIRTPVFEHTELFQRGVGEATDIVQKEMYTFPDRKGRSLTLRPEGTAPVARAFVEHKLYAGPRPWKAFYLGPMFRYERPQAGRFRQHHQVGAELLGAESPEADFETLSLFSDLLEAIGLRRLEILLNSLGDPETKSSFTVVLRAYLDGVSDRLCEDCLRRKDQNPLRVLDCKVPGCRELAAGIPSIQDHLSEASRRHQGRLLALLEAADIRFRIDPLLVRGLDYYTRTVFEIHHGGLGAQSAVGGGGRYDRLVSEVGGPDTPGVGFSSGIERLLLALDAEGAPAPEDTGVEVAIVTAGGDKERAAAQLLARRLRRRLRVETDLLGRGTSAQMKAADRSGARVVVVAGETELAENRWTVKNMASGEQLLVADAQLETQLDLWLGRPET